jgi:integrase
MKRGRIYKRGSVFWIQYWFQGADRRESTHSDKETVAKKLLTARLAGKDAGTLQAVCLKPRKFEDLYQLVEADYRKKENRSLDRLHNAFTALNTTFGGWLASAITEDRLNEYFKNRLALGKARATVKYEITVLRRAFKLAKLPVPPFESGALNNARQGFFEEHEFQAVLAHLPAYLQPVMRVARFTSWRAQSELLPLRWSHIDWHAGTMKLDPQHAKNKEGRTYPFAALPDLAAVLQAQREAADRIQRERGIIVPWVFFRVTKTAVLPIKSYKTAWASACQAAGYPEKLVHDLRRTGVRHLRQSGVPESVAMKLTGHRTRSVFLRYDIVDDKDLTIGVEKLAAFHAEAGLQDKYGTVRQFPLSPTKVQQG